jgi:hypothetical protein
MSTPSVNRPVSQFAKTHFPTPKIKPTADLGVGQHHKKNRHAPTHAREFLTSVSSETTPPKPFKLYKNAEDDFIQTIPLLFAHLENTEVVFHNPDYIEQIFKTYHHIHAHLFLEWVKTFARIRKADRTELLENIIQTTEDDFLSALQVFKLRSIKPKKQSESQRTKIVAAIQAHFADKPFTYRDLEEKTLICLGAVGAYLRQLKDEGKLKRVRKIGGRLAYKLIA